MAECRADSILVEKAARRMVVYCGARTAWVFSVALGPQATGDKLCEGDGRTPEGAFTIDLRVLGSHYHRALHVSYPDPAHRARARARGLRPGGDIMIHGQPNGFSLPGADRLPSDWTAGCIAVSNREIELLWRVVADGTPVRIVP